MPEKSFWQKRVCVSSLFFRLILFKIAGGDGMKHVKNKSHNSNDYDDYDE